MPKDENKFDNLPNVFVFILDSTFGYDRIIIDNENNNKNYNLSLPLFSLKNNRDNTVSLKKIDKLPEEDEYCNEITVKWVHVWSEYFYAFVKALKFK